MTTSGTRNIKHLAVVFVPTLLIIIGSGVLTFPERQEIGELDAAAREARALVAEAARVKPLLAHHETAGIRDIATVSRWLARCAPTTRDPAILLSDLRLMEIGCGVGIRDCKILPDSPFDPERADGYEDSELPTPRTGSTWRVEVRGQPTGLSAFLDHLSGAERLYVIRAARIERTENAEFKLDTVIFVPGLVPVAIDEGGQDG